MSVCGCACVFCVCVYVRTPQGFAFSVRFLLNKNDASQARTGHKALRARKVAEGGGKHAPNASNNTTGTTR